MFEMFSEGILIMISEHVHARIRILTLRVCWEYPRMGQIWSQIEKLIFLEVWGVACRISMATTRRGTPGTLGKQTILVLSRPNDAARCEAAVAAQAQLRTPMTNEDASVSLGYLTPCQMPQSTFFGHFELCASP